MSLMFIFSDPFCCVVTRCMYGLRYCDHITQVSFCLPSPCHISMLISGLPGLSYSDVEIQADCQVKISQTGQTKGGDVRRGDRRKRDACAVILVLCSPDICKCGML